MADPAGYVSKSDENLLLYYYFNSAPVSGVDIVNQADNGPENTDLSWRVNIIYDEFVGAGLYGVEISDDIDPDGLPGQWASRNLFAASGNLYNESTGNIAACYSWRNIDDWSSNAISEALGNGDFTFGGWFKLLDKRNHTGTPQPTILHFANVIGASSYTNAYYLTFNSSSDGILFYKNYAGSLATISNTGVISGTPVAANGFWNNWNHVLVRVTRTADNDGNYAYLFINGEIVNFSPDVDWADDVSANAVKYFSIGGPLYESTQLYQPGSAFRDFFFFDRALTSGEIQYIYNNDISKTTLYKSTNNNLLLWYRFTEPSGTPVASWATNTPTGLKYEYEKAIPLDTDLYLNNVPDNGIDGIETVDVSGSGHFYPAVWGDNPDQTVCASGNTTTLYHALRGEDISLSEISHVLASGSFSVSCWFTAPTLVGAATSFVFSFDDGSDEDLSLGLNPYTSTMNRFAYNDGAGSNHYLYNNTKSGNAYVWNHVVITHANGGNEGVYGKFYINGQLGGSTTDHELDSLNPPTYLTFFNNHDEFIDNQFHGAVKDFAFFDKELTADDVDSLYNNGIDLITTLGSGVVGGYALGRTRTSGIFGGYSLGFAYEASGSLGGFGYGYWVASGIEGGYTFSASRTSGVQGGFIYSSGISSGIHGGYIFSVQETSGIQGGYLFSNLEASGFLGGFVNGGLPGSGIIDAWFRLKGITYSDFDSFVEVKSQSSSSFDCFVDVFKSERPPFVSIKYPDGIGLAEGHDVSGVLLGDNGLLIWFVGSGVAVDGKTVNKARYSFGDLTSDVFGTASGTNEYVTDHLYSNSGIYIATLRVQDSNGYTGSDSVKIHLASGIAVPDVSLTANPTIGYAPLSVDFDYSITNIPAGVSIVSKVLFFGNGQSSINPDSTYTYQEVGQYIPVLIIRDSRGYYFSDSIEIGVNN